MLLQSLERHSLSQFLNHRSERYKLILVFSFPPPDAPQMWDLKTSGLKAVFLLLLFLSSNWIWICRVQQEHASEYTNMLDFCKSSCKTDFNVKSSLGMPHQACKNWQASQRID